MKEECHFSVMVAVPWDLGSPPGIYNPKMAPRLQIKTKREALTIFVSIAGLCCSSSTYSSSLLPLLALSWSASDAGGLLLAVILLKGVSVVVGRGSWTRREMLDGASSADNMVVRNADHRWGLARGQLGEEWVAENEAPIG